MRQLKSVFIILMTFALPSLAAVERSSEGPKPRSPAILHNGLYGSIRANLHLPYLDLGSVRSRRLLICSYYHRT